MPAGRRPTIRDVAEFAGVSTATVSNVVNGHAHVRDRTKQRVLDAIEVLGYQASRAARSLPAGRTFLLGYCLPDDTSPNAALDVFLHHVVSTAARADLEVLLFTQKNRDRVQPYAEMLRRGGADGFVLSGIDYEDPRVEFLRQRGIPFACFGRVGDDSVISVDVDGAAGIRAAVSHLHAVGHERIAFVGWPEGSATGDDRCGGFVSATAELGLEGGRVVRTVDDFDLARKLVPALVAEHQPTAVVCVSDTVALGVMSGLRDEGLMPGAEIAVAGFDDVPAASLSAPSLTSVRQPMDRVGSLLVERLVGRLTGEGTSGSVLVEPDLIVRESTIGAAEANSAPGAPLTQEGLL
ncbi:LacI family DNA-binding transcriptional regulator [Candidatus Poriferisocius sp.]|uniref:LacI family DNA-binding transcriptional regulator n=1 Tax=Candidatus Poriferisocius sp. TaxID=3101276 RepID=UPI003B5B08DE